MDRIVLDTNCLIASLSRRGNYYNVWKSLQDGVYTLCVSNEILEEYEEILTQKTNAVIASNVLQLLINLPNVELVDPHYHFNIISEDYDDNKFTDCAAVANAKYIVSNDKHFNEVSFLDFPPLCVIDLKTFSLMLASIADVKA